MSQCAFCRPYAQHVFTEQQHVGFELTFAIISVHLQCPYLYWFAKHLLCCCPERLVSPAACGALRCRLCCCGVPLGEGIAGQARRPRLLLGRARVGDSVGPGECLLPKSSLRLGTERTETANSPKPQNSL